MKNTIYGAENRGIVLLAGGASRRMGQDKWMMETGESTVLNRIITALYPLGAEVWIIAAGAEELDSPDKFPNLSAKFPNLHSTYDRAKHIGPLAGIAAGLSQCAQPYILVSATDMPFPSKALAEALFDLCLQRNAYAAIPEWKGRLHPLFAVYSRECLADLNVYIHNGGRKVMDWLQRLDVAILADKQIKQLDPQGNALFNMNDYEDYKHALRLLEDQEHLLE